MPEQKNSEKVQLKARICGMCGGVRRALEYIDNLLAEGKTVAVMHEPVHNRFVSEKLRREGVIFAGDHTEIPAGAVFLIGAHGSAPEAAEKVSAAGIEVHDATCPLVSQLQEKASRLTDGEELVFFGSAGHPEVVGIIGHSGTKKVFVISSAAEAAALPELASPTLLVQTTCSSSAADEVEAALKARFKNLVSYENVCRASRDRQQSVVELAGRVEAIVVAGSPESANANRLVKIAGDLGKAAFLVNSAEEIPPEIYKYHRIGISAGASTPEQVIDEISNSFEKMGYKKESW
jgi:4-hydroxy-3-methylbut-2-enyl diphosphate reductase